MSKLSAGHEAMPGSNDKTVCILTAGKGTRMGPYSQIINKALLPVGQKAILTHIIERFPAGTEFIIALGHKGEQVRDYVKVAHPELNVKFVNVDKFEGPGSGPGYSLQCCEKWLRKPFYLVACDTLWAGNLPHGIDHDWIGIARAPDDQTERYCNVSVNGEHVTGFRDKQRVPRRDYFAFVGLCFIRHFEDFFGGLKDPTEKQGEIQLSNGLEALVKKWKVKAAVIDWTDLGNLAGFQSEAAKTGNLNFSKSNEFLYRVNSLVIKFFSDATIAEKRVRRSRLVKGVFPEVNAHAGSFYAYHYVGGRTLYQQNSPEIFSRFLSWLQENLWKPVSVSGVKFEEACHEFYRVKTERRLREYFEKSNTSDEAADAGHAVVGPTFTLLESVPWNRLARGRAVVFHGDLQFDNVIYDQKAYRFTLIDWRQDFAGSLEFGDLYYDLAKMYGGIILNYDALKNARFDGSDPDLESLVAASVVPHQKEYLAILEKFIEDQGLDLIKVRFLVALIYLNMAALHQAPFDSLFYSLGRSRLHEEILRISR